MVCFCIAEIHNFKLTKEHILMIEIIIQILLFKDLKEENLWFLMIIFYPGRFISAREKIKSVSIYSPTFIEKYENMAEIPLKSSLYLQFFFVISILNSLRRKFFKVDWSIWSRNEFQVKDYVDIFSCSYFEIFSSVQTGISVLVK